MSGARLHVSYVNSAALLPKRSRLSVRLNKHVLAQITLQPRSPEGAADLKVPAKLLLHKYNDLEFYVTQNYTDDCSDLSAPELWTNIELDNSYIEMEYSLKNIPLRLSSIANMLFDPKMFGPNTVNLVLADQSPDLMRMAAVAASGVALRFEYRPVHFTLSGHLRSGYDNIVIGNPEFLSGILENTEISLPSAPLALLHMPDDKYHALIYIGGNSNSDMLKNAEVFSALSYPLPDAGYADIEDVVLPPVATYEGKDMVKQNTSYSFKDLGFSTITFQGIDTRSSNVTFRLSSDAMVKENENVVLSIHLAYSSGLRTDSALNMSLNGEFAGSIPLNDNKGSRYQGYRIQIPGSLLKSGYNTLSFNPVLSPIETGKCKYLQTDNLLVTLYEDSGIKIPSISHWIEMPSLSAFAMDGFPFTKWPDWRDTTVFLAEKEYETAAAALNLVSMISQKSGVQPFGINFSYGLTPEPAGEVIVMGPRRLIPETVKKASPFESAVQYAWNGSPKDAGSAGNIHVGTETVIEQNRLLVSEFESPFALERSVLLITANDGKGLLKGAFALWEPALQAQFTQDLLLIDLELPEPKAYAQQAAEKYYVGSIRGIDRLNYFLHTYFWLTVVVLLVSIVLLAWIIHALLKRHRAKRLADE